MFITKKHISRRMVLRGAGVALSLPLLDSMIPAQTPLARTAANAKTRFTGLFVPHGMAPGWWIPEGATLDAKNLPVILQPLSNVIDQTVVMSGMWSKCAEPPPGVTGADHWVASGFLAAEKPKKATGADINNGITIDQLIAQKIGQESLLPSLQQAIEDPGANSSNCGEGYSCAYTNSISWASHSVPLPMELNPQVVFERLFGDVQAKTPEQRAARRSQDRSILDSITQNLAAFKATLPTSDKQRVEEYGDSVREIERRLEIASKSTGGLNQEGIPVPAGVPDSFDEHIKLQFDLQALAYQADITRVSTLLFARDLTGRNFPASGTTTSFHGGSHHAENPDRIKDYSLINKYHVACLAYFVEKLKSIKEGNGNLLDSTLVLYGTNMGDSNQHLHYDVPHILVGGNNLGLKGGRHLPFKTKTITTGNLMLSILNMYGIQQSAIGDSTGTLPGLIS
ncbi:MAG: DUF1552 domain-containing protein [Bryobacteraceae bacterium]